MFNITHVIVQLFLWLVETPEKHWKGFPSTIYFVFMCSVLHFMFACCGHLSDFNKIKLSYLMDTLNIYLNILLQCIVTVSCLYFFNRHNSIVC
jgi:hypothetical protein